MDVAIRKVRKLALIHRMFSPSPADTASRLALLLGAVSAFTGDTRLLYGRPSQTGAPVQQPPQQQQQQQHQYAAYGQAMPPAAPVQAPGYVQPADPRRAVLADPRLASMQGAPPLLPHTHTTETAPQD